MRRSPISCAFYRIGAIKFAVDLGRKERHGNDKFVSVFYIEKARNCDMIVYINKRGVLL